MKQTNKQNKGLIERGDIAQAPEHIQYIVLQAKSVNVGSFINRFL
jgi:hypothetical protein